MGATGLGLLLEEHRGDIAAAWRQGVERELGIRDPALSFAVAPLLREAALALGGGGDPRRPSRDAWSRCAVLVRSTASPAQLAREFKYLHRAIWDALRARGVPVSPADRECADEWLQEALAEALDRLERVRLRATALEQAAAGTLPPIVRAKPPPLPRRDGPGRRPPPARGAGSGAHPASEQPIELDPIIP